MHRNKIPFCCQTQPKKQKKAKLWDKVPTVWIRTSGSSGMCRRVVWLTRIKLVASILCVQIPDIQSVESAEKLRESDRNLKTQHKELTSVALVEAVCRKYQRGVGMFRY